jgi:hypothetical protein
MNPLTGRTRYRAGWFGRLIIQVEYATREPHEGTEGRGTDWLWTGRCWRDARVEDISHINPPASPKPISEHVSARHPLPPASPAKETK